MHAGRIRVSQTTLIISAHPDDDVLGCGGTIAKLTKRGVFVHLAFLTDGVGARGNTGNSAATEQAALERRRAAAHKSAEILGVASVSFDDLPDNSLDSVPLLDVTKRVEALIEEHCPNTIFTHHAGDLNIDHRVVHQAVATACRPQRGLPVQTLLAFEVPSSTEWQSPGSEYPFVPNWFVDISDFLDQKLAAMSAYAEELRDWPHPRSLSGIEHLARWRGATIGCDAAEAYVLVRNLIR